MKGKRELVVIGATAAPGPDELPQFIDPICAEDPEADICYIAHLSPWDESAPQLQSVTRQRFNDECDAGYWQALPSPLPFRWGFRLVALEEGSPPSYLHSEEAYLRVRELGIAALRLAEREIAESQSEERIKTRLWYAARAIPEDSFPLLAAIAFDRPVLTDEVLTDLESELPDPQPHSSPILNRARDENWTELLKLVAEDPLGHAYLKPTNRKAPVRRVGFLEGVPDNPWFLGQFRVQFGLVATR